MSQTSSATTHPRGNTASHSISSPTTSETIDVIQGSDVDVDFDTMYESLLFEEINDDSSDEDGNEGGEIEIPLELSDKEVLNQSEAQQEVLDITNILQELSANIDSSSISKFNICRSDICNGIVRGMTRKSFSPDKKVSVKFTDNVGLSEGAVDLGGPMREFFTLAIEKVTSGKLFCGKELERFLSPDAKALKQDEYFYAGQLFAMSLVHCGIGRRCLSPILFDSIINGPSEVFVPIQSLYDQELQISLQQLMSAVSVHEANEVIAEKNLEAILKLAGTLRFMSSVSDVKDVATETAHWYVLGRTRSAFESFKNGLNCLGVLDSMLCNPNSFHQVMCFHEQVLSSATFDKLFTVCRSEEESNKWKVESKHLAFWADLLVDIDEGECSISLSDILFFASGLKVVPCRKLSMELTFLHDPETNGELSKFPKADTCSCVLYLPTTLSLYDDFKTTFVFAVQNAKGFGVLSFGYKANVCRKAVWEV